MELAKPVTGTAEPAPAHWAILSYTPKLVRITEIRIIVATVGLAEVSLSKWSHFS
ncbi:hypothetical protein D3C80_2133800 [compost metagenome]